METELYSLTVDKSSLSLFSLWTEQTPPEVAVYGPPSEAESKVPDWGIKPTLASG